MTSSSTARSSSKPTFVDTSGWMMLVDRGDPAHERAKAHRDAWMRAGGVWVSTDYVADETSTLLRMRIGLDAARDWWEAASASPRVRWESIDVGRAERARAHFFRWKEHAFSFTDCTSFAVMKELRLEVALTSDHQFHVAGYRTAPDALRARRRKT